MKRSIISCTDISDLTLRLAADIADTANRRINESGVFSFVLSGGSTPRALYRILAEPPYLDDMPWENIHLFWGDERSVPPDHRHSNYAMAFDAMICRLPLPEDNIHRMHGETEPGDAARAYELDILDFFMDECDLADEIPSFDYILLGIGEDGHTASLFPGAASLDETSRLVMPVEAPSYMPVTQRMTMTLPVIGAAKRVTFMVSGDGKREIVNAVLHDADAWDRYPAARVTAAEEVSWFTDIDL